MNPLIVNQDSNQTQLNIYYTREYLEKIIHTHIMNVSYITVYVYTRVCTILQKKKIIIVKKIIINRIFIEQQNYVKIINYLYE